MHNKNDKNTLYYLILTTIKLPKLQKYNKNKKLYQN